MLRFPWPRILWWIYRRILKRKVLRNFCLRCTLHEILILKSQSIRPDVEPAPHSFYRCGLARLLSLQARSAHVFLSIQSNGRSTRQSISPQRYVEGKNDWGNFCSEFLKLFVPRKLDVIFRTARIQLCVFVIVADELQTRGHLDMTPLWNRVFMIVRSEVSSSGIFIFCKRRH